MTFVCTTTGCISDDDPDGPLLTIGDSLPTFSVELSDGTVISNTSFIGKAGVIVFFNTGCSDCRKELPVIQELWEEFKSDENVLIAAIARDESADEIEQYWKENGLTMPYSPQKGREVYNLFAPSVIPRIFITDKKGIIVFSSDDSDMPSFDKLKPEVIKILN